MNTADTMMLAALRTQLVSSLQLLDALIARSAAEEMTEDDIPAAIRTMGQSE